MQKHTLRVYLPLGVVMPLWRQQTRIAARGALRVHTGGRVKVLSDHDVFDVCDLLLVRIAGSIHPLGATGHGNGGDSKWALEPTWHRVTQPIMRASKTT